MAATATETQALAIANRALARLGEQRMSLWGETSRNGQAVALHYEPTVAELLRTVPWTRSRTRAALALVTVQPVTALLAGFTAAWNLPTGCVMALDLASGLPYLIEGAVLLTDDPAPTLLYVYRSATAELTWDALFTAAVELRLASKLAFELTAKPELGTLLFQEAAAILNDARRVSLFEAKSSSSGAALWTDQR